MISGNFSLSVENRSLSLAAGIAHKKLRQEVNAFIRLGGVFDGVIDFDKALADPEDPSYSLSSYNGDKIRPNEDGYKAMAESVDLALLRP